MFALNSVGIYEEWLNAWDKSGRPNDESRRRIGPLLTPMAI